MPTIIVGGVEFVRVEVDVPLRYARFLRSFASYGRHCDAIRRALDSGIEALPSPDSLTGEQKVKVQEAIDAMFEAMEDVLSMKQPMSALHSAIREKYVADGLEPLWDQNQR